MDPAKEVELKALARQDPMNSVIDQFASPVQQFYCNATVFVTGGLGFLGKQLVEKLFRSCKIKKLYMLVRPKKSKTIQERLNHTLQDPVFDAVRMKQPDLSASIELIEGDVAKLRLGIGDKEWDTLVNEVDVIFHMAATTRFDEPLRVATLINVRGTRELIALAKECKNLKKYVHVSTAYANATCDRADKELLDQFYPSPVLPEVMIQLAETMDEGRLDAITPQLIKGWPNTYIFTKVIAENAVKTLAADLPACIIRPPIVTASVSEPSPGWMDFSCLFGYSGVSVIVIIIIILGVGMGIVHVFFMDLNKRLAIVPVDMVNNATIAAGFYSTEMQKDGIVPIYTIANSHCNNLSRETIHFFKTSGIEITTPKAIWYNFFIPTNNRFVYWFLSCFLHYIPAYIVELLRFLLRVDTKKVPSLLKVHRKIDKFAKIYEHFSQNTFYFKGENLQAMISRMPAADKKIYECDLSTVNHREYVKIWWVGIRKYFIKDGLEWTLKTRKYQLRFKVANFLFIGFYFYLFTCILYFIWIFLVA